MIGAVPGSPAATSTFPPRRRGSPIWRSCSTPSTPSVPSWAARSRVGRRTSCSPRLCLSAFTPSSGGTRHLAPSWRPTIPSARRRRPWNGSSKDTAGHWGTDAYNFGDLQTFSAFGGRNRFPGDGSAVKPRPPTWRAIGSDLQPDRRSRCDAGDHVADAPPRADRDRAALDIPRLAPSTPADPALPRRGLPSRSHELPAVLDAIREFVGIESSAPGARHLPVHGLVHRCRGLHAEAGRDGRPAVEGCDRAAPRDRARRARVGGAASSRPRPATASTRPSTGRRVPSAVRWRSDCESATWGSRSEPACTPANAS